MTITGMINERKLQIENATPQNVYDFLLVTIKEQLPHGFKRENDLAFYHETLRVYSDFPLRDGIVIKTNLYIEPKRPERPVQIYPPLDFMSFKVVQISNNRVVLFGGCSEHKQGKQEFEKLWEIVSDTYRVQESETQPKKHLTLQQVDTIVQNDLFIIKGCEFERLPQGGNILYNVCINTDSAKLSLGTYRVWAWQDGSGRSGWLPSENADPEINRLRDFIWKMIETDINRAQVDSSEAQVPPTGLLGNIQTWQANPIRLNHTTGMIQPGYEAKNEQEARVIEVVNTGHNLLAGEIGNSDTEAAGVTKPKMQESNSKTVGVSERTQALNKLAVMWVNYNQKERISKDDDMKWFIGENAEAVGLKYLTVHEFKKHLPKAHKAQIIDKDRKTGRFIPKLAT